MTVSSIHTNHYGDAGKTGERFAPENRAPSPETAPARESLQEVTDQAKLSSVAPRIHAMLEAMTANDGSILETLSTNIDKLQDGFVETLYATLSENGVDLTEKMTLRLDEENVLTVAGDHPEKTRMENILAQSPALSLAFSEIAAQSEVLRDIANIGKVMTRQTGADAYAAANQAKTASAVYQMSLKGEMSHFYFSRG